jgi:hypothetical protein
MRDLLVTAACAALLITPLSVRSDDATPPPPPPAPAASPAEALPPPPPVMAGPVGPEQTLGFQLRAGGTGNDRGTLGAAFVATSGPLELGVAGDVLVDTNGGEHYHRRGHGDDEGGFCRVRSNGRCVGTADFSFTAFGGFVQRTPRVYGTRLRLDLLGELGWQASVVSERTVDELGRAVWSNSHRTYPIVGVRGGVGFHAFRAGYAGVGAFVRQAIGGQRWVTTDGGRTRVGGTTAGLYIYGGADFGAWR